MEIELIEEPTFTLRMTTGDVSGFRVAAQWEGVLKMVNAAGDAVLLAPSNEPKTERAPAPTRWTVVGSLAGLSSAIKARYGEFGEPSVPRVPQPGRISGLRRLHAHWGGVDTDMAVAIFSIAGLVAMGLCKLFGWQLIVF